MIEVQLACQQTHLHAAAAKPSIMLQFMKCSIRFTKSIDWMGEPIPIRGDAGIHVVVLQPDIPGLEAALQPANAGFLHASTVPKSEDLENQRSAPCVKFYIHTIDNLFPTLVRSIIAVCRENA